MTRSFVTVAVAGLAASVLAAAARADLPKALDLAPQGAVAVIATPSLAHLNTEATALMNALGLPPMATPEMIFGMMGLQDAVNMDGSAAIVFLEANPEADKPKVVALLPVKDYAAMLKAVGGAAGGGAVDSVMIDGQSVFTKQAPGGFAVIGDDQAVVEGFEAKPGNIGAHAANVGKAGMAIADRAEIVILGNVAGMGPILDKLQEGIESGMRQMAEAGGPQAQQADAMMGVMKSAVGAFRRDGRGMLAGIDSTAAGVGLDMAVTFKDGSESGRMFATGGGASRLLTRLPAQPFMLAGAVDFSHTAVKTYLTTIANAAKAAPGVDELVGPGAMAALVDKAKGQSFAIYPNPAGFMGGVLANAVSFIATPDPKGVLAFQKDMLKRMSEAQDMPMKLTTTFTESEAQIEGVAVHGWSVQMDPAGSPEAMQMMQAFSMMFGPSGMSGFLAAANDGVFQTMSKNNELLKAVLAAGPGKSLAEEAELKQVAAKLPQGRFCEGYLGLKPILDQVTPMLAMFVPIQIQTPATLPPIGGALASVDGAFQASAFIPMPVIRFGATTAQQFQNMAPPPGRQDNQGGRPRF